MRKRLYETIFCHKRNGLIAAIYDGVMIIAVLLSISTLFLKDTPLYYYFDRITLVLFIVDYLLRLFTADYKFKMKKRALSFISYPLHPLSLFDLLSILPSLIDFHKAFKLLKLIKLLKLLRVFRLFELLKDETEIIHELEEEHHHHQHKNDA
jgi:voltage-gated potassium channel